MPIRCFFHLVKVDDVIIDDTGVDVADLPTARTLALESIEDLKRENAGNLDDWEGWSLAITDAAGRLLSSVSLGEATECHGNPRQGQFVS